MNETDTPTPRTDSVWQHFSGYLEPLQDAKRLSENLELELADATEELMETRKDYNCLAELLNGHDATECRDNLVRLKEQRDRMASALRKFVGDALFRSHADTVKTVLPHQQVDDSGDAQTMP